MPLDTGIRSGSRITAVLGPTNTGKTHYALERMLAHRTGVIGLPLRLLAREVYDRLVALRGPSVVALVTGEERIVPPRTQYWVCTVEAMPVEIGADFLAVDEIQLAADPDRGYIFTDRLLSARGLQETLFLGAETMRGRIAHLVPEAEFMRRERFSTLSYTGARKISRMPPRSAIVCFSVDGVYAAAELLRRQKGGAAVVMGALSPRTRNAQVDLFQNGDVDHLVATDAIGMGLNLDIAHVAFAGTAKFDGRRHRNLMPNELAQIAGRAGRYTADGTFGVTGEAPPFDEDLARAIEEHRFAPIRRLQWRNAALEFGGVERLIASLEAPSPQEDLTRAREADDLATLKTLAPRPEIRDMVRAPSDVRLLWECCQIPDFRKVSPTEHAGLCERIFGFVRDGGVPESWLADQIRRIDKVTGDIDTLSKRLAYIRTWTYVAQRSDWVCDTDHWRAETRAVEDRLSDALHAALTQRFVDRRTSILMRRLKQKDRLVAEVNDKGEVRIEEQFVGRLVGFRFQLDPSADAEQAKTLRAAALAALQPAFSLTADRFYNAPDTEIDFTEQGGLMWGEHAIGKFVKGADAMTPEIAVFVDDEAGTDVRDKVLRRLTHWFERKRAALFAPLLALRDDEEIAGLARGVAFRLVEAMGVLPRAEVAQDVKSLDQDQRKLLRKHGVRFGQFTLFQPLMLKPAPTRLRLVLWALASSFDEFPESPPPGLVTVPSDPAAPKGYYQYAGYRQCGERAIRIDMLERLADMIRTADTRQGFEASPDMLSITGLTLEQFAQLLKGIGYRAERGERAKQRAQAAPEGAADIVVEAPVEGAPGIAEAPGAPAEALTGDALHGDSVADASVADASVVDASVADPSVAGDAVNGATAEASSLVEVPEAAPAEAALPEAGAQPELAPDAAAPAEEATEPPEMEVFYTFTWAPRRREPSPGRETARRAKPDGAKPTRSEKGQKGKPGGKRRGAEGAPHGKAPHGKANGTPNAKLTGKPRPKEKPVDPDNPFAALAALKVKH